MHLSTQNTPVETCHPPDFNLTPEHEGVKETRFQRVAVLPALAIDYLSPRSGDRLRGYGPGNGARGRELRADADCARRIAHARGHRFS